MDSIAILELGPFRVHAWTLFVYAGAVAGIIVSLWAGSRRGLAPKAVIEAWLCALPAALIVGRLGRVLGNLHGYAAQPDMIWQMGRPMTYPGLLLGGAIGLSAYVLWRRASWRAMADSMALGLPVAQAIIWAGAMFEGVAYGPVTYRGWAWQLPDVYGVVLPRTPVQMVGIVVSLLVLTLLIVVARRGARTEGTVFAAFLLANSLARFGLGFARGDAATMIGPFRIAQLWYLGSAVVAAGLFWAWRGARNGSGENRNAVAGTARA
jgi:prolipoprotein diacylglyceryltransferase